MKFTIIHIEPLSGEKAHIYSLKYEGKDVTELQGFTYKFYDSHFEVIAKTIQRIQTISKRDGIQDSFFKRESPGSHNVFRLSNTKKNIRLYCIKFSRIMLLFGTGTIKKEGTIKNVENPAIEKIIDDLMKIEDSINKRLDSGDLKITPNGFEGDLTNLEI